MTASGGPEVFKLWLRKKSKKDIPEWVGQAAAKIFVQAGDQMVRGTPVGDATYWKSPPPKGYTGGRARGGWQPTMGTPAASDINRIDKAGSTPVNEGLNVASRFKAGDVAYWTNNTPYILRLAHGWSRQAPDGWVPAALRKVANQFRR